MKTKTFDCVAMKQEIQQTLREQFGTRPWTERNQRVRELLARDVHLARLLTAEKPESSTDKSS